MCWAMFENYIEERLKELKEGEWWKKVIVPLSSVILRLYLNLIIPICIFYQILAASMEFAFHAYFSTGFLVVGSVISVVLILHGLYHSSSEMAHIRFIFCIVDIIAALPYGIFVHHYTDLSWLILLIWLRLSYTRHLIFWHRQIEVRANLYIRLMYRIVMIFIFILCWVHIGACVLFHVAYSEYPDTSWISKTDTLGEYDFGDFRSLSLSIVYSASFYFSYTTISTVGYGDIHPRTIHEVYIVCLIMLVTTFVAVVTSKQMDSMLELYQRLRRHQDRAPLMIHANRAHQEHRKYLLGLVQQADDAHREHRNYLLDLARQ